MSSSPSSFDSAEAWLSGVRVTRPVPQWRAIPSSQEDEQHAASSLQQQRFLPAAVALDQDRFLVIGGMHQGHHLKSTLVYNCRTDTWTDYPDLNQERSGHAAVYSDSKVLVFGGYNESDYLMSIECLDLCEKKLQWTLLKTKLSCKRSGCAAVVVGPRVYIMGGYETRSDWASVDVFDVVLQKIRPGPAMTTARSGCAAGVLETSIFVVGGNDANNKAPQSMEVLDLTCTEPQWKLCPERMAVGRSFPALTVVSHCLVVLGGHDGTHETASVEVYDARRQTWWRLPNLVKERYGCAAVTLNSRILVVGGANNTMNTIEMLQLVVEHNDETRQVIGEIQKRLESLEVTVQSMSEKLEQSESKRKEEFQAIMSQLMQIKNGMNHKDAIR